MINSTVLIGRVTKDIDVRKTQSGKSVASFTLAVQRDMKNEKGEHDCDYISCVVWNKTAEFLGQYAKKGTLIDVTGRIQTRNYDDKDGKKIYVTEVVAEKVHVLKFVEEEKLKYVEEKEQTTNDDTVQDDFGESLDIKPDDLPF